MKSHDSKITPENLARSVQQAIDRDRQEDAQDRCPHARACSTHALSDRQCFVSQCSCLPAGPHCPCILVFRGAILIAVATPIR